MHANIFSPFADKHDSAKKKRYTFGLCFTGRVFLDTGTHKKGLWRQQKAQ
jgi:hypothetical protein